MHYAGRFCILIVLCTSIAVISSAQIITIDKIDTAAYIKKPIWNGNISAGLEVDKQSQTLFDASNYLDLSLQKYKELFILSASNRFTYNGSNSFLNTGFVHIRWRHNYKAQFHPESYVQYQWDQNRGMIHRFVTGENIRYNFWHKQKWEMSVATGLMYENELWNYTAVDSAKIPPNPQNQKASELKSSSYIKFEGQPSATSNLSAILFYQAAFNSFLKPRISVSIKYDISISKHFMFGVAYSGLYDVDPVVPIFKFYYNFSNTLAYQF